MPRPDWVGSVHQADEGYANPTKWSLATAIYAQAIVRFDERISMRMRNKPWAPDFFGETIRLALSDSRRPLKETGRAIIRKLSWRSAAAKAPISSALLLCIPTVRYIALEKDRNVSATALRAA